MVTGYLNPVHKDRLRKAYFVVIFLYRMLSFLYLQFAVNIFYMLFYRIYGNVVI